MEYVKNVMRKNGNEEENMKVRKDMKIIKRILDYICDILAPAFGVLCVTFAGNWQTRVLGIVILVLDLITYKDKDDIYR